MNALNIFVFVALFAVAYSAPSPGFFGKHEHHTIHVPYKVHTVHHHHVQKVHVPVVKHVPVPIYKEVPVHHVHHEEIPVPVHHVHHEEIPVHHVYEDHHDFHKGWSHGHGHGWL
ncbi:polyadenylate-binding protein 1-B [Drosophila tropicalis]|uniref:Histidine-rich glycoprotein n=1 Tax=Drosophila willistoni TaxID=7260 RepID=B4NMW1_DROWI|nr:histidine-rich glycoprotein [Drosophila willistoni]EDW85700.1 uncharacterized protein Dwil_GK23012 [Drosophila willistoni]